MGAVVVDAMSFSFSLEASEFPPPPLPPRTSDSSPRIASLLILGHHFSAFDIKLPRGSFMVEFTCDSCGERTKHLINRVDYVKGTVFLQVSHFEVTRIWPVYCAKISSEQCAGCLVYHKFVDNLGLVDEYDLREEHDVDDVDSDGLD
ncbi:hypothetical protein ACMD2_14973 [Ananas comosus]|uniref:DNL-type domain-containing protein n=1 Tax=Ananas comosus TaxID=4615 RepID=A0A199W0C7_ANACO|nr:hypothetical protein ACMD2_14973 [Ananas comosus]